VVANDSWVKVESMRARRFQATAIMIDANRWWITGGFSGTEVYNDTEIYTPGRGFSKGPNLPAVTFQHCLVKVNATHIFNVGGFPYSKYDVYSIPLAIPPAWSSTGRFWPWGAALDHRCAPLPLGRSRSCS